MAHFEELAASPPPSPSTPEHTDLNVTSASAESNALHEDTMKLLAEAESRLESSESRPSFGDNKLGEMIINTSSDNLDINLNADDTSTDKSECDKDLLALLFVILSTALAKQQKQKRPLVNLLSLAHRPPIRR